MDSLPITPTSSPKEIAEALAKTFSPQTLRETYESLWEFLPQTEKSEEAKAKEATLAKETQATLDDLNLADKESLVQLLFLVQNGRVSCRRAASEITSRIQGLETLR